MVKIILQSCKIFALAFLRLATTSLLLCSVSYAEPVGNNYAADGVGTAGELWDHSILKVPNGNEQFEHFLVFTTIRQMSRNWERTTSVKFFSQIFQITGRTFELVRDKALAKRVLEAGEFVQSEDWSTGSKLSIELANCDFLGSRFGVGAQDPNSTELYFFRASTVPMKAWAGSGLSCENLSGEVFVYSPISAQVPWTYNIDGYFILVDPSAPFAFSLDVNGNACFVQKINSTSKSEKTVIRVVSRAKLPDMLSSDLRTEEAVQRFHLNYSLHRHEILQALIKGKNCVEASEIDGAAFEDDERTYIKSESLPQ